MWTSIFAKKEFVDFLVLFGEPYIAWAIAACAITGAAGALAVSQGGGELTSVIITYLTGVIAAFSLIFLDILLRADAKEHRIIMNINDYLQNVLENSIAGQEVDLENGTTREQRRRLLRYARENTKKKAKDEPVSLEEKKVLEDCFAGVLCLKYFQPFFRSDKEWKVYPSCSKFVRTVSKASAFDFDILCINGMAPGWIYFLKWLMT